MLTDFICLLFASLLFWAGWRRGVIAMVLSVVTLGAAYAAGLLLARPVGNLLGVGLLDLQPLVAYPLGALVAFTVALILLSILAALIRRRLKARLARARAGGRGWFFWVDRAGGGLLGGAYGAAVALLVVWVLLLAQGLAPGWGPGGLRETLAGRLATPFAERFAGALAGSTSGTPAIARAAERFARDPGQATEDLQGLLADDRVQSLFEDRRVRRSLRAAAGGGAGGDAAAAALATHPTLRALAQDPQFVARASRLGLLEQGPSGGFAGEEVQRQLAGQLAPLTRAVHALTRDAEVQRLLKDELLVDRLEKRDLWALANDPKFNRLAELVLMRLRAEAPDAAGAAAGGAGGRSPAPRYDEPSATVDLVTPGAAPPPGQGARKGRVYRWRDRRGRVHLSDQPPKARVRYEEVKIKP